MSSIIRLSTTEEMMLSSRRLKSMLYFCGLVFLVSSNFCWQRVSSFSTRLPTSCGTTTTHNNRNNNQIHIQQQKSNCYQRSSSLLILTESSSSSVSSPETTTDRELQDLFSKYCDEDRLISRKTIESIPPFDDMLRDGDLLPDEFNDVWEAALKSADDSSRVDDVSFIQIYRDVDDLFEEDDDEEEEEEEDVSSVDSSSEDDNKDDVVNENKLDTELLKIYISISDEDGLISKDVLMQWDEVQGLIEDGLLGEDEFDELFEKTSKNGMLDDNGFFHFNVALEDLFDFDDDDDDDDNDNDNDEASTTTENAPRSMITEDDLPPGVLFSQLCDENYLVGMDELNLWTELKDMLKDGDLLPTELLAMYNKLVTSDSSGKLNEAGFLKLYDEIDSLFEEDDDEDDEDDNSEEEKAVQVAAAEKSQMENMRVKEDLLSFLEIIQDTDDAEPCGLSADESDQEQVLNIVSILEKQSTNIIKQKDIVLSDLAGNWELLYTSSAGMKFNKGLSGIGGSFPNGRFGGLNQKLTFTKYVSDMEYKERIEVTPSSASFDVTVTGSWDLRTSVSLFTGQPTIILYLEPDRVKYVLGSTRADHWKSLGPTNRMDLSYLDDDIRVMRGCTSTDTLLIYRKIS